MEQPLLIDEDNNSYSHLVAGGKGLTFKDSNPPPRSPPFGPRCPCKDRKVIWTLLGVALLIQFKRQGSKNVGPPYMHCLWLKLVSQSRKLHS
jgi:hypothetical protein